MSRTFTHKTDESTLTTLCPRCLNAFRNTRGIRVRRADPYQLTKEPCTYCRESLLGFLGSTYSISVSVSSAIREFSLSLNR